VGVCSGGRWLGLGPAARGTGERQTASGGGTGCGMHRAARRERVPSRIEVSGGGRGALRQGRGCPRTPRLGCGLQGGQGCRDRPAPTCMANPTGRRCEASLPTACRTTVPPSVWCHSAPTTGRPMAPTAVCRHTDPPMRCRPMLIPTGWPRMVPPTVCPRKPPPTVCPSKDPPTVCLSTCPPTVCPRTAPPAVCLRTGLSTVCLRTAPPTVCLRKDSPTVCLRMRPPTVCLRMGPPTVCLCTAGRAASQAREDLLRYRRGGAAAQAAAAQGTPPTPPTTCPLTPCRAVLRWGGGQTAQQTGRQLQTDPPTGRGMRRPAVRRWARRLRGQARGRHPPGASRLTPAVPQARPPTPSEHAPRPLPSRRPRPPQSIGRGRSLRGGRRRAPCVQDRRRHRTCRRRRRRRRHRSSRRRRSIPIEGVGQVSIRRRHGRPCTAAGRGGDRGELLPGGAQRAGEALALFVSMCWVWSVCGGGGWMPWPPLALLCLPFFCVCEMLLLGRCVSVSVVCVSVCACFIGYRSQVFYSTAKVGASVPSHPPFAVRSMPFFPPNNRPLTI
jgi:hypothetical protein